MSRKSSPHLLAVEPLEDRITPAPTSPSGAITAFNVDYLAQAGGRTVRVEAAHPNPAPTQENGLGRIFVPGLRSVGTTFPDVTGVVSFQNESTNFLNPDGTFEFTDLRVNGTGVQSFTATGFGSLGDTAAAVQLTIPEQRNGPLNLNFTAQNASNPDIQFAVANGNPAFGIFTGFEGLAGAGNQNPNVTVGQTLRLEAGQNQAVGFGVVVTHPLRPGGGA